MMRHKSSLRKILSSPILKYKRESEKTKKDVEAVKSKLQETINKQNKQTKILEFKTALIEQQRLEYSLKEARINDLLHEIRKINSSLKDSLDTIDFDEVSKDIQNIWAQYNLLSIRMRCYDFQVNPDIISQSITFNFPVYKKIDKIRKCLRDECRLKKTEIKLNGNTYLAYRGHDILEVAFYILLENAIKYVIPDTTILVNFRPQDSTLNVEISNKCNNLPDENEIPKLTERGFRGSNATVKGSGLGLHTFHQIMGMEDVDYKISLLKDSNIFVISMRFLNCTEKSPY